MADRYKKRQCRKNFFTFTFETCYTCLFSLLKVKELDADDVNNKLRQVCKFYLSDSTISRLKGYAKT